ncbi:MAG: ParA family protein [Ruminiclostridium sp.]|nr:ParA family protein [Ruminiclostridium sp.]
MKIIAIANHKGGVGKTTSVANLGVALARKGKRVLLIDLDAQQNLTFFFLKDEEAEVSIFDALKGTAPLPVLHIRENLDLTPSSIDLARAEQDLNGRIAREYLLKNLLAEAGANYDFILLDCPPSLGVVTYNALVASTDLYITLTAEALPYKGLTMLEEVVGELKALNRELCISGVFITRYNNRNLNNIVAEQIRERYGDKVFKTKIRENIAVAEAPLAGEDIFTYAPESNGAKDYEALADEILNRNKE